jgi:glycosyltransferase involved in cell wall biosynthesis
VKVLHLTQRYPPAVGGAETWCREVCQVLAASDEMKVLTMDIVEEEEFWRDPPIERCTIRLGPLDWDGPVLVRRYPRSLPIHTLYHSLLRIVLDGWLRIYFYGPHSVEMYGRLRSEVRGADVVHLHTVPYPHNFFGYVAARLGGKRVVITPHFHPGHPHYERWSNYWLLRHCDAVIAVSEYERDYLVGKGIDRARIVTTGNGVHVEAYRATDPAGFKAALWRAHQLPPCARAIVFLGRKLEYKGIATLVEACRRLSRAHDAALFLAGPSTPWFDEFYASLPPSDRARVIDLGVLSHADKVNLLHLADVLVLPSRFEAFGIVLLEAWACGTPVIAAATGAMPSIVGDGGLIFEHGDPADLAKQLDRLLSDSALASEAAKNGLRRLRERYTWDKIAVAARTAYGSPAPARRLRVLVCSNLFPPHTSGGAEIVAFKEAQLLKELGVDVHVFCGRVDAAAGRTYPAFAEAGLIDMTRVGLFPADLSGEWWNFRNDLVRRRFVDTLERFAPDVVHFHNLVGLTAAMIDECAARGIPTALTLHDYWGICFKNTLLKNDGALCRRGGYDCLECKATLIGETSIPSPVRNSHILLSLLKVTRLISPSRYLADRYAANGIPEERIVVMRNGIDLGRFAPSQGEERAQLTLGFIGYLGAHKGLAVLLRALALVEDPRSVRLLVAGDGEDRARLQAQTEQLGLEGLVTFLGRIDNSQISALYARMDVLVVPSVWPENSPVTITEAMASGIPVIASDIGGIGELVEDGVTGLLAPARDVPALADRIDRLRKDPQLRRALGAAALEKIRGEEVREQLTRLRDLFEELVAAGPATPTAHVDVVLYSSTLYWHRSVRELIRELAHLEKTRGSKVLVCRFDLCEDSALEAAKLLVLPTPGGDALAHGLRALARGIPLLVTDAAPELVELGRRSNAVLFYSTREELREYLALLLGDERLRDDMGAMGQRFVRERSFTR